MLTRRSAVLELVFAGALWGFGFIAAIWALEAMGPLTVTGLRFALASGVGALLVFAIPSLRVHFNASTFRLAFVPGLLLSLTLVLQTWGLKYTTATKSGFITCLYVLIVPILERVWLKKGLPKFHLLFAFLALIGVALICDLPSAFSGGERLGADNARLTWNFGDFLTLLCALAASFQILWFVFVSDRITSPFVFNVSQSIWAGALPLVLALLFDSWPTWPLKALPLTGLLALAFGSTLIAFALQVRAQKEISPSLASLLFLLESPFATLFAIYLLHENLKTEQWVGAGLILTSVIASTVFSVEAFNLKQNESEV